MNVQDRERKLLSIHPQGGSLIISNHLPLASFFLLLQLENFRTKINISVGWFVERDKKGFFILNGRLFAAAVLTEINFIDGTFSE
jgi:hypothetical protein